MTWPTAMTSPDRGDLRGIGLIMEGFGYNPIIWDRVTDMTFRDEVPPLEPWVDEFVHRRYGKQVAEAEEAWESALRHGVPHSGQPWIDHLSSSVATTW